MEKGGLDTSDLGKGQVVESCEHGNEISASIKTWKFLV
jgi:hypothetical protein